MGETRHSSHSFIFDSDLKPLGTDYIKAHASLSLPFFREPKNQESKKILRYFPKCDSLLMRKTSTLARAEVFGIKCWYSALVWKLHSYPSWESDLRSAQVKRDWVSWFHSPRDFNQKFSFWTCCFPSVSLPLILHLLWLHLHRQFNSLWNSKRCPETAHVHVKCLYMAQKLNLALKLWPSRNAGTLALCINMPYG